VELWIASLVVLWLVVLLEGFLLTGALRQIGLFQLRLGDDMGALITDTGLDRGAVGPDFDAIDTRTGEQVTLSGVLRGRAMVVFMTPTCLACRQLAPHLNEVIATHREISFAVVCTSDLESGRQFANRFAFKAPVLVEGSGHAARQWEVKVTPLAYVLDQDRRVLIRGVANDWNQLESLLEQEGALQDGRVWERVGEHLDAAGYPGERILAKE
jgi:methylamine dehydrogenase accessory protein MauD